MERKTCKWIIVLLFVIIDIIALIVYKMSNKLPTNEYLYYVGQTQLDSAVFVNFGYDWYVTTLCVADSCLESQWCDREDVYPYILGSPELYAQEVGQKLWGASFFKHRFLYDKRYYPYVNPPYKTIGDSIFIYQFKYNVKDFDMFFCGKNGYSFSPRNDDLLDAFSYDKEYRIALRAHYPSWKIIIMRIDKLMNDR